jgi:hypothetical protein
MKKIFVVFAAVLLVNANSFAQSLTDQYNSAKTVVKTQADTATKTTKTNATTEAAAAVDNVKSGKVTNVSTAKTQVKTTTTNVKTTTTTTAKATGTKVADKVVGTDSKGRKIYEDVNSKKYTLTAAGKKEFLNQ